MRRILTKFRIEEISAIDKPAASHCRALIMKGQAAMTPLQEFTKIETDAEAIRFAKRVSSREIESPLSKSEWIKLIELQAEGNFTDPKLSSAQKFARYLDTPVGRELFWAAKAAPNEGAPSVSRQADFIAKAANLDGDDYIAKAAEMKGEAHARMHALAIDHQRATGKPYARAYAHVYSAPENEELRNKVKSEHLSATLSGAYVGNAPEQGTSDAAGDVGYASAYGNPNPGGSGPRPRA